MRAQADYEAPANVAFVRFNERGAITAFGQMARGIVWDFQDAGERILIGEGTDRDDYVDLSEGASVVRPRPTATWAFDRTELLPRQEAVMRALPKASVTFTGPSSGSQPHEETSDLRIGWTVPGDYRVTIESFPFKPLVVSMKVLGRAAAGAAQANVEVEL